MYKITGTWITDTGFATGLSPTLNIYNYDGSLFRTVTMTEVGNGNYKYDFDDINTGLLYFFNMDAGTDSVIGRFKSSTNQLADDTDPTRNVFRQASRREDIGGIMDSRIDKLFKKLEELEKKEIKIEKQDNSEYVADIARLVVSEIGKNRVDLDYSKIDKIISDKIKSIKMPTMDKYDDSNVIELISNISDSVLSIGEEVSKYKNIISDITTKIESLENRFTQEMEDDTLDKMSEIKNKLNEFQMGVNDIVKKFSKKKGLSTEELEKLIEKEIENEIMNSFKS